MEQEEYIHTSNKKLYDITIIELKDNEFDISYYLQIDDDLFLKNEIKISTNLYYSLSKRNRSKR